MVGQNSGMPQNPCGLKNPNRPATFERHGAAGAVVIELRPPSTLEYSPSPYTSGTLVFGAAGHAVAGTGCVRLRAQADATMATAAQAPAFGGDARALKDVIAAKERELSELGDYRVASLEAAVKERDEKLRRLQATVARLRDDFGYNLKLVEERDVELAAAEEAVLAPAAEQPAADAAAAEPPAPAAEAELPAPAVDAEPSAPADEAAPAQAADQPAADAEPPAAAEPPAPTADAEVDAEPPAPAVDAPAADEAAPAPAAGGLFGAAPAAGGLFGAAPAAGLLGAPAAAAAAPGPQLQLGSTFDQVLHPLGMLRPLSMSRPHRATPE